MNSSDHEAFWSARYRDAGEDYLYGTAPNAFLASQLERLQQAGRVLSLADGEGRNSVWAAEQGLEVVATEISPVALEKARKLARGRGVQVDFRCQDILASDWPPAEFHQGFDAVLAIFIQFMGAAQRQRLFQRLATLLRPGGCLFLQGYGLRQLELRTGGPGAAENLYTARLLEQEFPGWEFLLLREHEGLIEEGAGHRGMSALVDAVLRRPA